MSFRLTFQHFALGFIDTEAFSSSNVCLFGILFGTQWNIASYDKVARHILSFLTQKMNDYIYYISENHTSILIENLLFV